MNKMSTIEKFLFIFLVFPLSFVLSGLVIQYGWNNILITLDGVPSITLAQAVGLDILISFILVSGGREKYDYDFSEMLSVAIGNPILVFALLRLVTLFL